MKRSFVPVSVVLSAVLLCVSPSPLRASMTCVYVDNLGNCNGFSRCYPTIQQGIDAATPGQIVSIFPGVYHEQSIIEGKDHLTLRAFDMMQKPVIAAPATTNGITGSASPGLKIVNLIVEAPDGYALVTLDTATGDVTVQSNEFRSANGINVRICTGGSINSNRVNGGDIHSSAGANNCRIELNTVVVGNIALEEAQASVTGNSIRGNALLGGGITLSGNTVKTNILNGNVIDHGGIIIVGNNVSGNLARNNDIRFGWGITLDGGVTGNIIETNFVSGSRGDGIIVHATNPGEPNRIRNNTSIENEACDIEDTSTPSIDNVWTGNRVLTVCGSADPS